MGQECLEWRPQLLDISCVFKLAGVDDLTRLVKALQTSDKLAQLEEYEAKHEKLADEIQKLETSKTLGLDVVKGLEDEATRLRAEVETLKTLKATLGTEVETVEKSTGL